MFKEAQMKPKGYKPKFLDEENHQVTVVNENYPDVGFL